MPPLRTALLVFDNVDVLDFSGPFEVLYKATHSSDPSPLPADNLVDISIIASKPTVRCASPLTIARHMSIEDARQKIATWDIVIVPGGPPTNIMDLAFERDNIGAGAQIMGFLREYTQLTKSARKAATVTPEGAELSDRVLMSICTGALFLGKLGVLAGKSATTHHLSIPRLRDLCAGQGTQVLACKRWVDGGLIESGDRNKDIRLITAGGISSGLDASLYLVKTLGGLDMAKRAADIMEYKWRLEDD